MKKVVAVIWLVVYLCVSTGFAVSTHYCMNTPRSVELGAVHQAVCEKCGMLKTKSHGCCRDEITVVKLQQDAQLAKLLQPSFALSLPVAFASSPLLSPFYNFVQSSTPAAFQPPPLHEDDLNVANCVFRI